MLDARCLRLFDGQVIGTPARDDGENQRAFINVIAVPARQALVLRLLQSRRGRSIGGQRTSGPVVLDVRVTPVDAVLGDYFAAWNEPDGGKRARLLQRSLGPEAELVDPTGCWRGVNEVSDRISRYHAAAPGTKVVPGSGVDAHNHVERYAWKIVDPAGNQVMEGLDVAERDPDRRLRRILMFHGRLPGPD